MFVDPDAEVRFALAFGRFTNDKLIMNWWCDNLVNGRLSTTTLEVAIILRMV